jgi:hypothetical protein
MKKGIKQYLARIGCLQWVALLGSFVIQTATMTMVCFRTSKIGCIAAIQVQSIVPDLGNLPEQGIEWFYTVYGNGHELIPTHSPEPL